MNYLKHIFLLFLITPLFIACGDEDKNEGSFEETVNGIYYSYSNYRPYIYPPAGVTPIDNMESKAENSMSPPSTVTPFLIMYRVDSIPPAAALWFHDSELLCTPVLGDLYENWVKYQYEKDNKYVFVRSGYRYDPATGRLTTDKRVFAEEQAGETLYVTEYSTEGIVMRVAFNKPMNEEDYYPSYAPVFPSTFKEYAAAEMSWKRETKKIPAYVIFDTNEEAITYIKELIKDFTPSPEIWEHDYE